jgi:hypothetical protein
MRVEGRNLTSGAYNKFRNFVSFYTLLVSSCNHPVIHAFLPSLYQLRKPTLNTCFSNLPQQISLDLLILSKFPTSCKLLHRVQRHENRWGQFGARIRVLKVFPPAFLRNFVTGYRSRHENCLHRWYSDWLRAGRSGFESWGGGWEFFSSTARSDRFWGPPTLLSNWYRKLYRWE